MLTKVPKQFLHTVLTKVWAQRLRAAAGGPNKAQAAQHPTCRGHRTGQQMTYNVRVLMCRTTSILLPSAIVCLLLCLFGCCKLLGCLVQL